MKYYHNWKKMNTEDIAAEIQHLQLFRNLHSSANIENYTNYLLEFIDQLIENTISWFRLILKYSCRWWISEIQNTVHQIQIIHHQQASVKKICTLNQVKRKIIHRVKTAQFYKNMHEAATEKQSIWKLTCWIKKKNHLFFKSFIIFFIWTNRQHWTLLLFSDNIECENQI